MKNIGAIIVTVPHKFASYSKCSSASPHSHLIGSVNIMRRDQNREWHGDNFDGPSMVSAILACGGETVGKRALLVGAGGAGSSIALALLEAEVSKLAVHDADPVRRDKLIRLLAEHHGKKVVIGSADPTGFKLIVNATPMGMHPKDGRPVDVSKLRQDMFCACVITAPSVSPWIKDARRAGCVTSVGTDMFEAELGFMVDFIQEK